MTQIEFIKFLHKKYLESSRNTYDKTENNWTKIIPMMVDFESTLLDAERALEKNQKKDTARICLTYRIGTAHSIGGVQSLFDFIELTELRAFTATQIERAMLFVILRTKFNGSLKITKDRYIFDFEKCTASFLRQLVYYILNCDLKRINISWLEPLQQLIIDKELSKKQNKYKKDKPFGAYLAEYDPFDKPYNSKKTLWEGTKKTVKSKPIPTAYIEDASPVLTTISSGSGLMGMIADSSGTQQNYQSFDKYFYTQNPYPNEWTSQNATEPEKSLTSIKLQEESKPLKQTEEDQNLTMSKIKEMLNQPSKLQGVDNADWLDMNE